MEMEASGIAIVPSDQSIWVVWVSREKKKLVIMKMS